MMKKFRPYIILISTLIFGYFAGVFIQENRSTVRTGANWQFILIETLLQTFLLYFFLINKKYIFANKIKVIKFLVIYITVGISIIHLDDVFHFIT